MPDKATKAKVTPKKQVKAKAKASSKTNVTVNINSKNKNPRPVVSRPRAALSSPQTLITVNNPMPYNQSQNAGIEALRNDIAQLRLAQSPVKQPTKPVKDPVIEVVKQTPAFGDRGTINVPYKSRPEIVPDSRQESPKTTRHTQQMGKNTPAQKPVDIFNMVFRTPTPSASGVQEAVQRQKGDMRLGGGLFMPYDTSKSRALRKKPSTSSPSTSITDDTMSEAERTGQKRSGMLSQNSFNKRQAGIEVVEGQEAIVPAMHYNVVSMRAGLRMINEGMTPDEMERTRTKKN